MPNTEKIMSKVDKLVSLRDSTPYKAEKDVARSLIRQIATKNNITQSSYDDWQGTIGRKDRQ